MGTPDQRFNTVPDVRHRRSLRYYATSRLNCRAAAQAAAVTHHGDTENAWSNFATSRAPKLHILLQSCCKVARGRLGKRLFQKLTRSPKSPCADECRGEIVEGLKVFCGPFI